VKIVKVSIANGKMMIERSLSCQDFEIYVDADFASAKYDLIHKQKFGHVLWDLYGKTAMLYQYDDIFYADEDVYINSIQKEYRKEKGN